MQYLLHFEGRLVTTETQKKITHALLGRRDEQSDNPPPEEHFTTPTTQLTPEQAEAVLKHAGRKVHGRYATQVLDWFESEEEAQAAIPAWPEHLDIRVVTVGDVLP